ncbi:unnamed protein product [Gadus morhua 'NCC']
MTYHDDIRTPLEQVQFLVNSVVKSDTVCSDHSRHSVVLLTSGDKMGASVVAVCHVVLVIAGGKPGCSYRGFPEPTPSTPCDTGSQSGRPGSLSPNQSVQSSPLPGSNLGATRWVGN